MSYHHIGIAVKDIDKAHAFYTKAMGFKLVKAVKRLALEGGWTKHIFYDIGDGELFAIWDLRGMRGVALNDEDWRGGMSTGVGLPFWINHIAFDCKDEAGLEVAKKRWLDNGYHVSEIDHEFIRSIYTIDPDGTLVEFTYDTVPLNEQDVEEAHRLLADNNPATEPEYEAVLHKSPNYEARKATERSNQ